MKSFITQNSKQTQKLGEMLAAEILVSKRSDLSQPKRPKEVGPLSPTIICLSGELGAGKTTFTQGLLKGLKVKGPYTSPTFVIMKHYKNKANNIYHVDAYRVDNNDIINLGWKEIVADDNSVIIIEWADRIKKIIPKGALWVKFEWVDENKRKIFFKSK
jgi:tRNA threonylcarbamoyladenosine biosynthesis protein TsaE